MQRRHAIIAAIALVALVLIPAAALAAGAGGGFGHRGPGPGPKNCTASDGTWAGNATHPNWNLGDGPGNRTMHANATCPADLSGDRDRGLPGDAGNLTAPAGDQDRPRFGNRTAANRSAADETGRTLGLPSRGGRGPGR